MRRLFWLPLVFAAAFPPSVLAQELLQQRLTSDRVGYIAPGSYLAGDKIAFTLDAAGASYLLRLAGSPEVFVLNQDPAAMGGRVLKYDSGETALKVAGWGALTLYVSSVPDGLPAERTGDSTPPASAPVSLVEVQSAAIDAARHLSETRHLNLHFMADWSMLSANPATRAFALDSMANAARGIDRFVASPAARDAVARRIDTVAVSPSARPTTSLNGHTLIVTFNSGRGYLGRASSLAIARTLGRLLSG